MPIVRDLHRHRLRHKEGWMDFSMRLPNNADTLFCGLAKELAAGIGITMAAIPFVRRHRICAQTVIISTAMLVGSYFPAHAKQGVVIFDDITSRTLYRATASAKKGSILRSCPTLVEAEARQQRTLAVRASSRHVQPASCFAPLAERSSQCIRARTRTVYVPICSACEMQTPKKLCSSNRFLAFTFCCC